MINLGHNSGRDMPPVYLRPQLVDFILEGLSVLLLIAAWVLVIVFYDNSQGLSLKLFSMPVIMTMTNIMLLWSGRAPIRYYNFPVKLNERNYVMQYFIAGRFVRIANLIVNLMMFGLFTGALLEVKHWFFVFLTPVAIGMLLISLIVYRIIAYRYR